MKFFMASTGKQSLVQEGLCCGFLSSGCRKVDDVEDADIVIIVEPMTELMLKQVEYFQKLEKLMLFLNLTPSKNVSYFQQPSTMFIIFNEDDMTMSTVIKKAKKLVASDFLQRDAPKTEE